MPLTISRNVYSLCGFCVVADAEMLQSRIHKRKGMRIHDLA